MQGLEPCFTVWSQHTTRLSIENLSPTRGTYAAALATYGHAPHGRGSNSPVRGTLWAQWLFNVAQTTGLLKSKGAHNPTLNEGRSVSAHCPKNQSQNSENFDGHCSLLAPHPPGGRGEWAHLTNL